MIGPFLFLIVVALIGVSIPVLIAVIAYLSRQSKRKKIIANLPVNPSYIANVRLNTPKKNAAFFKLKAFEFSGVLYIDDKKVIIDGTKGQHYEFDLQESAITWPGVQVQNGALQWFCIDDMKTDGQKLFVNADTGVFVFRISSKIPSTKEIYEYLLSLQRISKIG